MGNVQIKAKEYSLLKEMIENKESLCRISDCFDDMQLIEMLKFLKKSNYRVFMGSNDFEPTLVTKEEYIKQMGYFDSINNNGEPIKICVISDLHLGSIYDTPKLVEKVWDFCTELGIKHILNLGDLTDGCGYLQDRCKSKGDYKFDRTLESEIAYLNKFVPQDKNIRHHILYGNHDLYSADGVSKDISKSLIEMYDRKDLIVCGVEDVKFQINNDYLHLFHHSFPDIVKPYLKKIENEEENQIILAGHSHISRSDTGPGYDLECIPSLSNVDHHLEEFEFFTGFVVLTIEFNKDLMMNEIHIQRYRFDSVYSKPVCFHTHNVEVRRRKK